MAIRTLVFGAVVAFGALASCTNGGKPTSLVTTTPRVTATTTSPAASRPVPELPPAVVAPQPCSTAIPILVTTENLTTARGDLCAAFNRSINQLRNTNALGAGGFEIRVRLSKLVVVQDVSCNVGITVSSKSMALASITGGAKVGRAANLVGNDRLAARDCIDAVLEDLMMQKVAPLMQQQLASLAANAGSGASPPQPTLLPPTP